MNISAKRLEVLSELLVDFNNMNINGIDLLSAVRFQGWEYYFNRLQAPVFFNLVKEFWIHAKSSSFRVTSFVFGKRIVILEKLIAKLIGHYGYGIRCESMMEKELNINVMYKVILSLEKTLARSRICFLI